MFTNKILWFDVIDSTNNEAYRNVETALHGSVWAAHFQTAGKGQQGNKWESAAGENLLCSILLRPLFLPPERQFLISQIVALSVCDLLDHWGVDSTIKWPNDIYVGNNKVQGMLIEHFLSGSQLSASIVGVGINLNQIRFDSNTPNPTSVFLETGITHLPKEALQELLGFVHKRYKKLEQGKIDTIEIEYKERLYRFNQLACFRCCATKSFFWGKIVGVNENGCLMVKREEGVVEVFSFQEIKYILDAPGIPQNLLI